MSSQTRHKNIQKPDQRCSPQNEGARGIQQAEVGQVVADGDIREAWRRAM